MGNRIARNRLKAQDFNYIAKNTAFLTNDVSCIIYIFENLTFQNTSFMIIDIL